MASYGLIGAIGGAAQGFSTALQSQLEEARQLRLEQLRTKNNQETNKLNNDQRHSYSTKENEQRHDLSLIELSARGEQEEGLIGARADADIGKLDYERSLPPLETYKDDTYEGMPGKRNERTNEFTPHPVSAANRGPNDAQMHQYWMSDLGGNLSTEEARNLVVKEGETPDTYRRRIVQAIAGSSIDGTVDEEAVRNAVLIAFPETAPAAPRTFDEAFGQAMEKWGGTKSEAEIREAVLRKFPQFAPK